MQEVPIDKVYQLVDKRIKLLREMQRYSSVDDFYWLEIQYACNQLRKLRREIEELVDVT